MGELRSNRSVPDPFFISVPLDFRRKDRLSNNFYPTVKLAWILHPLRRFAKAKSVGLRYFRTS